MCIYCCCNLLLLLLMWLFVMFLLLLVDVIFAVTVHFVVDNVVTIRLINMHSCLFLFFYPRPIECPLDWTKQHWLTHPNCLLHRVTIGLANVRPWPQHEPLLRRSRVHPSAVIRGWGLSPGLFLPLPALCPRGETTPSSQGESWWGVSHRQRWRLIHQRTGIKEGIIQTWIQVDE